MNMRIGYVVDTHPEDHSVDLVMVEDGARLTGVQLLNGSASERTGTVDIPAVPKKDNKWDITQSTGQDMKAVVGYIGRHPVVVGFLYPQVNQVLSKDPKLRYSRHQSDVEWFVDGDGNLQLSHPCGAYIRIGENTDKVNLAGKNADANSSIDRNTDKKVSVRVSLADSQVDLTMGKDGKVTLKLKGDISIQADGKADIHSGGAMKLSSDDSIKLEAPRIDLN